ncbi:type II secretion system protein [Sulfurospirillum barnesii]|uniref:Prepilin-type N-terminal cleavage/methylation domain-containing protein n=1 Tax=Sulfurospirillum barnesii (strain ATCC 700032 / DSM 10660 / SES-3) TaxID=760154 RepID=I3XYC9_SULBS|nr:prepilin-type N-terminal cleavage/methylation domain-containing protein [Sulfurospirillum barnesii]AFL68953.1 prepilin-type N-terminal cleavage/methylation domain-containing protein [Sulfurospirillum barnesii SES-3]
MKQHSSAFTMIELVFVIVILGILAAVAIPRMGATRDDAMLVKGKSQIASIRSGISLLKSKMLLEGNTTAITKLDDATANAEGQSLFKDVLEYPIVSKNGDGNWMKTGTTSYTFKLLGKTNTFEYNTTAWQFNCTGDDCTALTQ